MLKVLIENFPQNLQNRTKKNCSKVYIAESVKIVLERQSVRPIHTALYNVHCTVQYFLGNSSNLRLQNIHVKTRVGNMLFCSKSLFLKSDFE